MVFWFFGIVGVDLGGLVIREGGIVWCLGYGNISVGRGCLWVGIFGCRRVLGGYCFWRMDRWIVLGFFCFG